MSNAGYTSISNDVEKADGNDGPPKPEFKRSKTVDQTGFNRAQMFIATLTNTEADSPLKKGVACFLKYLVKPLILVIMCYIWIFKKLYQFYKMLPINIAAMIWGIGLCFCGGVYCFTIAAAEAAKNFGGEQLVAELTIIWEEVQRAQAANEADDKIDANNDGVADVKQMSNSELISHKAKIAMQAVKDPERIVKAVQFLVSANISVVATLKFQFARAVSLALGISNMVELPVNRILGPVLAMAMGKDIQHWIPAIIGAIIKIIAVCIAAKVQSTVSGFYAGLKGAQIFAMALISILGEQGIMDKCPDWIAKKPFDANESWLDEAIGWPLAAAGLIYQLPAIWLSLTGVPLDYPFVPLNILFWPFTALENYLRFQVLTS